MAVPKKKKSVKKKGKSKATSGDDAVGIDGQYKKALLQIELLKAELAHRTEVARRAAFNSEELREELSHKDAAVEDEHAQKMDIASDLTRQYKTMQAQLMGKVVELRRQKEYLQEQLVVTQKALDETRAETERTLIEKNDLIAQLTQRVESMESTYEQVLNDALDMMAGKVEEARDKWEIESFVVQQRNKERLMEFGLSHATLQ
eukprot:m.317086 g.317086  ORF g.317086 m.317086 type:complete len:204 (-) comp19683_c0_seq10:1594-2205(-)